MRFRDLAKIRAVLDAVKVGKPVEPEALKEAEIAVARESGILAERSKRQEHFFSRYYSDGAGHAINRATGAEYVPKSKH